ncbi:type IV pilus assembly protein PilN [Anaerovirgula multivorans]|uniref:Type IV pilus assembly protein PilN n=1 Tax=Anaerovirgula multivorans TaxID=312168 RepID=A0A238ZSU7_9FIRM|nr:PilN domain-containing protein [Anaerovirgula multivorans]SNR86516.1 type IV pilus assembly protein PilN [Anaerovirgula multivorans]
MRDFNFFEPYLKKTEKTSFYRLIILSLITVVSFIFVFYPVLKYFEVRTLKKEILVLDEILESSENIKRLQVIESNNIQLIELKSEQVFFSNLHDEMKEQKVISDLLIQSILKNVPNGIFFDSLSIANNEIEIHSKATHKFAVAQMEHNLRYSPYFDEVFIPSISENDGYYLFTITFTAKEVTTNAVE